MCSIPKNHQKLVHHRTKKHDPIPLRLVRPRPFFHDQVAGGRTRSGGDRASLVPHGLPQFSDPKWLVSWWTNPFVVLPKLFGTTARRQHLRRGAHGWSSRRLLWPPGRRHPPGIPKRWNEGHFNQFKNGKTWIRFCSPTIGEWEPRGSNIGWGYTQADCHHLAPQVCYSKFHTLASFGYLAVSIPNVIQVARTDATSTYLHIDFSLYIPNWWNHIVICFSGPQHDCNQTQAATINLSTNDQRWFFGWS